MDFTDFMLTVPAWLRALLAVTITVGITLAAVTLLYRRILWLNTDEKDEKDDKGGKDDTGGKDDEDDNSDSDDSDDPDSADDDKPAEPAKPKTEWLAGRIMSVASMAFVFLLAFTLSNLWSDHRSAENAAQSEASNLARANAAAAYLPALQREALAKALTGYAASVRDVEWPLMQRGDQAGAIQAHERAATAVVEALVAATTSSGGNVESSTLWSPLTTAIDDTFTDGTDRLSVVPSGQTSSVVFLVCVLGVLDLAITTAFQPAPFRRNLFMIGTMAALIALLMFVVVEASNPYLGADAIHPTWYR